MLKRILVPLETSPYTPTATRAAAEIALHARPISGAAVSVLGLGIVDTEQIPKGRFASLVPREEIVAESRGKVEELIAQFRELTASLGLTPEQVETRVEEGPPYRKIIHESVLCDLVVMGPVFSFPPLLEDYQTLKHLYHHCSRPLILTGAEHRPVETVVMAMDGTGPSSRMMYSYAHLNPFPQARVVLLFSRAEEQQYNLAGFFDRVADYLRAYELRIEVQAVDGPLEAQLPAVVQQQGAAMVALGIPAEQFMERFRDSLGLGEGAVQRLLRETGCALFSVH